MRTVAILFIALGMAVSANAQDAGDHVDPGDYDKSNNTNEFHDAEGDAEREAHRENNQDMDGERYYEIGDKVLEAERERHEDRAEANERPDK